MKNNESSGLKIHIKGREEGDMGARKVLRGTQANLGERGNYSYGELGGKMIEF